MNPMLFNFFLMDTPSHIFHGTWRHPASRSVDYANLDMWLDLAKRAEEGKIDAIFMADNFGMYEEPGDRSDRVISNAIQIPCNDPVVNISAMSAITENLGFIYTSSILQHHPSSFARQAATLDHSTKGRIGWNVVTSFVKNAARSVGEEGNWGHDERYRWADEYVDVAYKLWEGSWDDGAVMADKKSGVYADPSKVHKINHTSERYRVEGPLMVSPSPQRTPVIFQAGTSPAGKAFAAKNAEGIFLLSGSPEFAAKSINDVKALSTKFGRNADDILFLEGTCFVVGSTEEEARRKDAEIAEYIHEEAYSIMLAGAIGIDVINTPLDTPLTELMQQAQGMRSRFEMVMAKSGKGDKATLSDLVKITTSNLRTVGTPETICDRIEEYRRVGIDGFNVMYALMPSSYVDFLEYIAPELRKRGLMKTEYAPGTLREKMFAGRGSRINSRHPAAKYIGAFSNS